ncbi:hypothetical protein FSP39_002445 [Pinctada imbricata]|uniref:Uncharacterized protein n=1 Tax=Pinctada imbricata TaxID=66713 RepID=A0AA88YAY0_PINIB|nr:hypothetical protein FSP39_002445 [Pinctada imbricata]
MFSVFMPKNGTDVRLPPALYYHRNSDPLLHRRSQSQNEEFGEICLLAKTRRRSEKDFSRNHCRNNGHKNCILNHSPTDVPVRRGSTPLCNGYIPSFKHNGVPKGLFNLDANCDRTMHESLVNGSHDNPWVPTCDISKPNICDDKCDGVRGCLANDLEKSELDDMSIEHEEHAKLRCEESLTIDIPELFSSSFISDIGNEDDIHDPDKVNSLDVDDVCIKNIDISPRVLCNGTLITSNSDHDIESSENHPFILRDDSISGSECSVKRSLSWQKPRPLSSLSIGSGENIGSLPGSLERHLTVVRNNSGSGSESNCYVKPPFSKKNPVSNFSSRSCSPQPGPSGYDVKTKRAGKKTVTYSDTGGDLKAAMQEEISHNATYQTSLLMEWRQQDKHVRKEARKADRGTLFCACGMLTVILGVIFFIVYFV